MKKLLYSITLAGLLFSMMPLQAQVIQTNNMQDFAILNNINETNQIKIGGQLINTENLDGSPYLEENFVAGQIIDTKEKKRIKAYIRYRIFDDVFEVKKENNDDSEIMVMKRSPKYKIEIPGNKSFTFAQRLPIMINGVNNGYVEVLTNENTIKLYKRLAQEYDPGERAKSGYSSSKEKAKLETEVFYFIEVNETITQIEPHKRRAADAFPSHQDQLEEYIKDNRLKFRGDDEEKDLIQLVKYYNSIAN